MLLFVLSNITKNKLFESKWMNEFELANVYGHNTTTFQPKNSWTRTKFHVKKRPYGKEKKGQKKFKKKIREIHCVHLSTHLAIIFPFLCARNALSFELNFNFRPNHHTNVNGKRNESTSQTCPIKLASKWVLPWTEHTKHENKRNMQKKLSAIRCERVFIYGEKD